jgi:cytochrome P450
MNRLAVKDFTFSDGTNLPAGSMLQVSAIHMHLDAEVFDDPLKFDGFRFVKMKERAVSEGHPEKKFDIVTTGAHSLAFGHGKHACPGRFFAAMEIKLMLAYVVMTYDMKLVGGVRPPDSPFLYTRMPNARAEVLFRRRKVDA